MVCQNNKSPSGEPYGVQLRFGKRSGGSRAGSVGDLQRGVDINQKIVVNHFVIIQRVDGSRKHNVDRIHFVPRAKNMTCDKH